MGILQTPEVVVTAYDRILVAVDFADETAMLCERARDLSRRYQATLAMIHVVEPLVVEPAYDVLPSLPAGLEGEMEHHARKELLKLGDEYGVAQDHCWLQVGSTKTEILRKAEEWGADLILLGSHGRHGVELLLGSTANSVLHGARCDVLAVRVR